MTTAAGRRRRTTARWRTTATKNCRSGLLRFGTTALLTLTLLLLPASAAVCQAGHGEDDASLIRSAEDYDEPTAMATSTPRPPFEAAKLETEAGPAKESSGARRRLAGGGRMTASLAAHRRARHAAERAKRRGYGLGAKKRDRRGRRGPRRSRSASEEDSDRVDDETTAKRTPRAGSGRPSQPRRRGAR